MKFERKAVRNECISPDFSKRVFAVRDFPTGCGCQRFSSEMLSSMVQPDEVPSSTDDSKPKDKLIAPFNKGGLGLATKAEVPEIFLQDSLNNARVVAPSKTSVCQTTTLPNASVQLVAKMNPPLRRLSATRHFPQGCGRQAPQVAKVPEGSTVLETSEEDHKKPDVERAQLRKQGEGIKSNVWQTNNEFSEIKEKVNKADNDKSLGGKFAGQNSKNTLQKISPACLEFPRNQVIVQALMAAPNCPWRQGKRLSKPKLLKRDQNHATQL